MVEQFEYLFRTEWTWLQIRLTLSPDTGLIEYDCSARLVGPIPLRYTMHCDHRQYSDYHGGLLLTLLEQHESEPVQNKHRFTEKKRPVQIGRILYPDTDDEVMIDMYSIFHLEYVRLPEPQIHMQELKVTDWPPVTDRTNTFSLITMIHFAGYRGSIALERKFKQTSLGRGLAALDKMHFAEASGKFVLK